MKNKSRRIQVLVFLVAALIIALNRAGVLDAPAREDATAASVVQEAEEGQLHWANPDTLQDHFERHGADFSAKDPEDYARQAHALYLNRARYQVKTDADGTVRVYDAATNAFGAYSASGATKTYFMPGAGQAYFDRQPGR